MLPQVGTAPGTSCDPLTGIRVDHKTSQVQSPLEVTILLNLFGSSIQKPLLPTLLTVYN